MIKFKPKVFEKPKVSRFVKGVQFVNEFVHFAGNKLNNHIETKYYIKY